MPHYWLDLPPKLPEQFPQGCNFALLSYLLYFMELPSAWLLGMISDGFVIIHEPTGKYGNLPVMGLFKPAY